MKCSYLSVAGDPSGEGRILRSRNYFEGPRFRTGNSICASKAAMRFHATKERRHLAVPPSIQSDRYLIVLAQRNPTAHFYLG
jgi:hypothetical protein